MSLKDATKDKHTAAEATGFMKSVFDGTLDMDKWADFTHQKSLIYNGIEGSAGACGLLADLPDIQRAHYLYLDYKEMTNGQMHHPYRQVAIDYYHYIKSLYPDKQRVLAHLYVWHMGDLFGGQMIKKVIKAPHRALDFKDPATLMTNLRGKLDNSLADEANVAFDWAIKLLQSYE